MSSTSKSRAKNKRVAKEQKTSSKATGTVNGAGGMTASAYNPILGTFHNLETSAASFAPSSHINGHFRNMDESDEHSGSSHGSGGEFDSASNNDNRSVESEELKEKPPNLPARQDMTPGTDNDKREKIRHKNERKHQRQKERRAQELYDRCSSYLMSRKLEALAQQLVGMGFSAERATVALMLNEGKVEEAVAWLFEGGEETDKQMDKSLDAGGNLKIDISQELARISELEIQFKCSKQEVERAIVSCEGDLDKAEETLRAHKQDLPQAMPPKSEETSNPPSVSNGKVYHSSLRPQLKSGSSSSISQQGREEKDFNYAKPAVAIGSTAPRSLNKNAQALTRIRAKLEFSRPQQTAMPTEKRWPGGGSSTLQVSLPPENYVSNGGGGEHKILQPTTVREPVVVMQPLESIAAKPSPVSSVSFSPLGTISSWYPSSAEIIKPNGLLPHIPSRSYNPNNLSSDHFHHQQFTSGSGSLDPLAINRGNVSWGRLGASPTLAAASSLGLFPGFGSNCLSGSSPVDWNTGGLIPSCDYTNIDWSLDRSIGLSKPNGFWPSGSGSFPKNSPRGYSSSSSAMRPTSSTAGGDAYAGGSCEWTSPFEGKDLFSLPRQFPSSPSL